MVMRNSIMGKILDVNTVYQCNQVSGAKSLHPLVRVINLSEARCQLCDDLKVGFYTVALKEYKCEHYPYGRKACDYSDGTVVFLSPGESLDVEKNRSMLNCEGWMLAFHPELIRTTSLGMNMEAYTFFSYHKEESLHISEREKKIFMRCVEHIGEELHRSIDRYSGMLVTKSIELLLDYCTRFYERQFIVRCEESKFLVRKTERIINQYFTNSKAARKELPTGKYFAEQLGVSTAYFADLLKHETGQTINEYVEAKRMEIAKRWLVETDKTVLEIANTLSFSSPEYFSCLFRKLTGLTPSEYRMPS